MTEREILERAAGAGWFIADRKDLIAFERLYATLRHFEKGGRLRILEIRRSPRAKEAPVEKVKVELTEQGLKRLEELRRQ
jgi:hypothetical protein